MKSRDNQKSLFRNGLQAMSPLTSTNIIPKDIATSIVDGMRIVRLIRVGNLQTKTFRCWTEAFVEYPISLPSSTVHLVFDDYKYEFSIPSKSRDTCNLERKINHLDQELPSAKEWDEFLMNENNKFKLVNLIVGFVLSNECTIGKTIYVNNQSVCYLKSLDHAWSEFEPLNSTHRVADQKIPMHAVFAGSSKEKAVCVIADDTDIYISLLFVATHIKSKLYFRQGKVRDKNGISFHDVHSLADHLGTNICSILPSFHALTGSDFTNPFFGRSKITEFKKLLKNRSFCNLLDSLGTNNVNILDVTNFILHMI